MEKEEFISQEDINLIALWIDEGALEQEPAIVTFNVNMSEEELADIVTRNSMIGTEKITSPAGDK